MNWYVVDLLFAQTESDATGNFLCETCQILFSAPSALAAYDRGVSWAAEHTADGQFQFVGVEHIHSLDDEPKDGVEIGGTFYESEDVWQRKSELIPEKAELTAIRWEENGDVPLGELMDDKRKDVLKRALEGTDGEQV